MERDSRLGSSQTVALVAVRQSSEGVSDSRARVCETVERLSASTPNQSILSNNIKVNICLLLVHGMASSDALICTRAMLPSALLRCSLLHPSDAIPCTKAMLSRAPKATGHIGSFWRKSSRASKGSSPAPRREALPRLDGRPSRASTGDPPARRRETLPQGDGKTSRKAKGDLHPTATRLFY